MSPTRGSLVVDPVATARRPHGRGSDDVFPGRIAYDRFKRYRYYVQLSLRARHVSIEQFSEPSRSLAPLLSSPSSRHHCVESRVYEKKKISKSIITIYFIIIIITSIISEERTWPPPPPPLSPRAHIRYTGCPVSCYRSDIDAPPELRKSRPPRVPPDVSTAAGALTNDVWSRSRRSHEYEINTSAMIYYMISGRVFYCAVVITKDKHTRQIPAVLQLEKGVSKKKKKIRFKPVVREVRTTRTRQSSEMTIRRQNRRVPLVWFFFFFAILIQ